MKLTEFLVRSPKLNEITKPGIKSQLKMEPHGKHMFYKKKKYFKICRNDVVILSNKKKYYIFVFSK